MVCFRLVLNYFERIANPKGELASESCFTDTHTQQQIMHNLPHDFRLMEHLLVVKAVGEWLRSLTVKVMLIYVLAL